MYYLYFIALIVSDVCNNFLFDINLVAVVLTHFGFMWFRNLKKFAEYFSHFRQFFQMVS